MSEVYTEQQLREAWDEFAAKRKHLQAEFQLLSQPYEVKDHHITVNLLSPVHESMLNNIKMELAAFLKEKVKNTSISVSGLLTVSDDKKVIYTNRDKFDYLAEKNPILKELKDRLGLDTDF
jgi:2'-5' RNA ligase